VFTNSVTGQVKPATITNGLINVLGKESESVLQRQMAAPVNIEQKLASRALLDPNIDLVLVEGLAGSGKNIIVTSSLFRLFKTNKDKYDKIVYIRNPVDDVGNPDEEIGFLSTNEGKEAVYLGPMEDTLEFLIRNNHPKGNNVKAKEYELFVLEKMDSIKEEYNLTSRISLGLRGTTFNNTLVICDEMQNASIATMQKILTRVGKNSKVVVLGSQNQIDSKYLTKYNNAFAYLLNEANTPTIDTGIKMFAIQLNKTQRSAMCEFAENLYNKVG